jgi:glutamine cyclotransferase
MKKIVILFVLLTFVGVSVFQSCSDTPISEDTIPAEFTFDDNLAVKYGEIVPVQFKVNESDLVKIELIFNDSIFQTWNKPSGKLVFDLNAGFYGVGAKVLTLQATRKNGEKYSDQRVLRVLSDIAPELLTASIVQSYKHNPLSFTQGLEFNNGELFESTGDPNHDGSTIVSKVKLQSGETIQKNGLDATYFGEGITVLGDKVYQITWREQKCFVYDKATLQLRLKDFTYSGEGWGLCNDGKSLIMSDGTERIVFRDPETFQIERSIEVYDQVGPRAKLNELEYIDGKIYANVWMLDIILVIDPNSGKVLAEIDASTITTEGKGTGDVLNGIAYNPTNKKLYLTGKYWSKLFEVKITKEGATS